MLASLLFAALLPAASVPSAAVGPPTLCHPLDIGSARSLPWDGGAFGAKPDYDLAKLPQETYDILMRSDDALVHVETLRRAAIYLSGMGGKGPALAAEAREELVAELLSELEFDADVHAPAAKAAREACAKEKACGEKGAKPACDGEKSAAGVRYLWQPVEPAWGGRVCQAQGRDAALCFLDVGFLRAALREAGLARKDDGATALRDAQLLKPADPALRLGATLGLLDHPDQATRDAAWKDLDTVVELADDAPAREHLHRNLLATVGPLVSARDHDDLVQKLHHRNGG